jgi:hypothetical protein
MKMNNWPNQGYTLPPLSDFVVTKRKPRNKLPEVLLIDWCQEHGHDFKTDHDKRVAIIDCKEPTDVNIILHPIDVECGWSIVWQK